MIRLAAWSESSPRGRFFLFALPLCISVFVIVYWFGIYSGTIAEAYRNMRFFGLFGPQLQISAAIAIICSIALRLGLPALSQTAHRLIVLLLTFIGYIATDSVLLDRGEAWIPPVVFLIQGILPIGVILLTLHLTEAKRWLFFFGTFLVSIVLTAIAIQFGQVRYIRFVMPRIEMAWIFLLLERSINRWGSGSFLQNFSALLLPSHLIGPLPFTSKEIETPWNHLNGWKSCRDLARSLVALNLASLLAPYQVVGYKFMEKGATFTNGCAKAAAYFLLSYGALNLVMAVFRCVSGSPADATSWALLSSNPFDRWRRWNIPFYDFFRVTVLVPLVRRKWRIEIVVLVVFFLSYLIHDLGPALRGITALKTGPWHTASLFHFFFFMSHAVFMIIASYLPMLFPSENLRKGWIGVLMTELGMVAIHTLAP